MYKVVVKGGTYVYRDELKQNGANWDAVNKVGYFNCMNEHAMKSALRDWNDRERRTFAYVEEGAEEAPKERVVVWFKCNNIENVDGRFLMTDEAEDVAQRSINEFGKVFVDLNGNIRDPEGLTLADVDEVRELDLKKDFK